MDFEFSEEETLFREEIREYLTKNLRPLIPKIDESGIPRSFVKDAAKLGIWAMPVSKDVGGQEASFIMSSIAAEEIARADFSMATVVMFLLESGWGYVLDKYGSKSIREEVLPRVTSGDWFLGVASTEPSGGSDIGNIKTRAIRENDKYVINGEKSYISGVLEAKDWGGGHLTLVRTSPNGNKGISIIYVPINEEGIEIAKINNMGRMGISSAIIRYNNVKIPAKNIVGEENKGFYQAMDGFNHARVLVSAACIGASEAIFDIGIEYLKNREAFGKKLKDFQAIAFEAADLKTRIEMARLLTYKAAWALDHEEKYKSEIPSLVAMAKMIGPQVAFDVVKSVMMWMGAYGYSKDALIEIAFRGIVSYIVGAEGALNIMRIIISKGIFG